MKKLLKSATSGVILAIGLSLCGLGCHRPASPADTAHTAAAAPAAPAKAKSHIEQCLDAYVAKPERGLAYKFLARASVDEVMPIAQAGGPLRVAQYLLLRIDFLGADADNLQAFFALPFSQIVVAARSTLWPLPIKTRLSNSIVFEQASAFNGCIAGSHLTLRSMDGETLSSFSLIEERLYALEVWQDRGRSLIAIDSNELRIIKQSRGGVNVETRSGNRIQTLDWPSPVSGLAVVVVKADADWSWTKNFSRWPAQARAAIPERFTQGLSVGSANTAGPTLIEFRPASSTPSFDNPVGR